MNCNSGLGAAPRASPHWSAVLFHGQSRAVRRWSASLMGVLSQGFTLRLTKKSRGWVALRCSIGILRSSGSMSGLLLLVDGRCLILVYDVSQRRRTMGSRHEAAHNQASRCDSGWDCQRQSRSARIRRIGVRVELPAARQSHINCTLTPILTTFADFTVRSRS